MYKGKNKSRKQNNEEPQQIKREKLPRGEEVLGIIEQRLGGSRMSVSCLDKITRNCRVPGKLKRKLWLRPGDIVIVKPWEFDKNKGDIIFKYTPTEINFLKNKGFLKTEDSEF
jgi:translation initiation factor 1A